MRLRRTDPLQREWYSLAAEIRGFVESLKTNPNPPDARAIPERPGYYEEFISGRWIGWTVDRSTGEDIIIVTID